MRNRALLSFFSGLSILFYFAGGATGQSVRNAVADVSAAKPVKRIIKKDGWIIPEHLKEQDGRERQLVISDKSVTIKGFHVRNYYSFPLDQYYLNENSELFLFSRIVEVAGVSTVSINGKTYAILVRFSQLGYAEGRPPIRTYVGPPIEVGYLDDDGDGKFETRFDASKPLDVSPKWATGGQK